MYLHELKALADYLTTMEPWFSTAVFFAANATMIWRLGILEEKGFEGTVLGTLIMPYCSGLPNLVFAYVMGKTGGDGTAVLENCLVNNVTNLTLLLGLPAIIWKMEIVPSRKSPRKKVSASHRLNYLSLLLTLIALMFFTGTAWALSRDGSFDFGDGVVLAGLFLFWQILHVFDILKANVQKKKTMSYTIWLDLVFIAGCGYLVYASVNSLVAWLPRSGSGWLQYEYIGWLSGVLMVLPNALLAFYYAGKSRADITYSSQAGDSHICIPLCIGVFAIIYSHLNFTAISIPDFFQTGALVIVAACGIHLLCIAFFARLPRFIGFVLVMTYVYFLYKGLLA